MSNLKLSATLSLALASLTTPAMAYIGPGLGLGTVGVILGVIASVLLAVVAVVWYPIKRGWRKLFKKSPAKQDPPPAVPPQDQEKKKEDE